MNEEKKPTVITVRRNSAYRIEGDFIIYDHDGNLIETKGHRVSLCRCGQSSTKPFCDDTHKTFEFDK